MVERFDLGFSFILRNRAVHHHFPSEVLDYYLNTDIYLCTQWTWVINHLEDKDQKH